MFCSVLAGHGSGRVIVISQDTSFDVIVCCRPATQITLCQHVFDTCTQAERLHRTAFQNSRSWPQDQHRS